MAPVEEDSSIVGRHLIRQAQRATLDELQSERGESVTLLELRAHVASHKPNMATCLLAYGPSAVFVRYAVSALNILTEFLDTRMLTNRSEILAQEQPPMPRPKAFDPDAALQKAMQVFWERGYEATSVEHLVQHMGINRFSLYSTFGGKHQLFVAALERYRDTIVADLVGELEQSAAGLAAIRRFFMRLVDFFASSTGWHGCLMTNTVVELAPHDPRVAARVQGYVVRLEEAFYRVLLQTQPTRQRATAHACRDLARFLMGSALGLGVLAKTSPGRQALEGYVRVILSVLV